MDNALSRFLTLAATLPLATAALPSVAQVGAPLHPPPEHRTELWRFHHEHVLGTSLELTLRAASAANASRAEAAALAVFAQYDALLSTWRADSEATRWSRTRCVPVRVSPELFDVLSLYDVWRERTHGALDASVEAATRVWQRASAQGRVPTDRELSTAVEAMQQPHWQLDAATRTATRLSDVPLVFASFTKSYISARAAAAAERAGATGVVVNIGGDVIVRGAMTQRVAIVDPAAAAENDTPLTEVVVRGRAVATSGSYRRGVRLDSRNGAAPTISHLLDPRSAQPVRHVLSSTVIAPDAVTAAALATTFSVLPVRESVRLAATVPQVDYLLVLAGGEQVRSAGWPETPGLRTVALSGRVAAPLPATSGMWDPAWDLTVTLELPRMEDARYRRPYVAVWVEDADHFPVRTLALWLQQARWLPDLKQWYRDDQTRALAEGSDLSRTVSSATRPPGRYTLRWDGKDNEGKLVKAGRYTLCIEAAREHGGYDVQRHELTVNGTAQTVTLPAAKELGATTLDYRQR